MFASNVEEFDISLSQGCEHSNRVSPLLNYGRKRAQLLHEQSQSVIQPQPPLNPPRSNVPWVKIISIGCGAAFVLAIIAGVAIYYGICRALKSSDAYKAAVLALGGNIDTASWCSVEWTQ